MLTHYDYLVIGFYFVFMLLIGWLFQRFNKNVSDYFRGGGQMRWWMVGSSAFMVQFSAWTFTGAAGKAFQDGPIILTIYFANAVGFFINFLGIAAMFRQFRVVTPVDALRQRFGRINEQFFTWMQLPVGTLYAGIWLNSLAVFFSAAFGLDMEMTIWVTGIVVLFIAMAGGAWGVVAGDFIQVLILMPVTLVASIIALAAVGGPARLLADLPGEHWAGNGVQYAWLAPAWIAVIFIKQFTSTNNMMDSTRYLTARDSQHAKKAALMATVLFILGPVVWFIPPIASSILYPDIATTFPQLKHPQEAAYVIVAVKLLPAGMLGLVLSGMFAATMSSMDGGLNRNAGIFIRNFYHPLLRPRAGDQEMLIAGKITTLVMGLLIVLSALYFSRLKDTSLFMLMVGFGTLVAVPIAVPMILGLFVRKTPDWAAWSTVLFGLLISWGGQKYLDAGWLESTLGLPAPLTAREADDWSIIVGIVLNLSLGSAWFVATRWFYREPVGPRKEELETFFHNLHRPVTPEETGGEKDSLQGFMLGRLSIVYGIFVMALALIPNSLTGRFTFLICGGIVLTIGILLWRSGRKLLKDATSRK